MAYVSSPENFLNSLKNKILLPGVSLGEGRGEGGEGGGRGTGGRTDRCIRMHALILLFLV